MVRHYGSRLLTGFILLLIPLVVLSSCGGRQHGATPALSPEHGAFSLEILDDDYADLGRTGSYELRIEDRAAETAVVIYAEQARGLKSLYLNLTYDPAAFDPVSVTALGAMADQAQAGDNAAGLLSLAVLSERGVVHYGQILARPQEQAGFSGSGPLAEVRFSRRPFASRTASVPPVTDASAARTNWDVEARTLTWYHSCQGDYNQDGLVTVNDLTPLGVHFNEEGPFEYESARSVIDGNDDGFITVNDITPIGQNFSCGVDGYVVFADGNAGNLPPANDSPPALEPYDYVPFGEAGGDKLAERLHFTKEYPELPPDWFVWVRPAADDQVGTPSIPQYSKACLWQIFNVSNVTPSYAGTSNSVAMVNGMPAVCYREFANYRLVYQRATSPIGASWETPVVLDDLNDPGFFTSMAVVNGNPAISYYANGTGSLRYVPAQDAEGIFWYSPVSIDTDGDVGRWSQLLVVNGNPAICYQDYTNDAVKFVRAADAVGSIWGTPVIASDAGGMVEYCSMVVANGNPAICYYNASQARLEYVRANDANGGSWGSVVLPDNSIADEGTGCSMFMVNGRPAIAYWSEGSVYYVRAADANGTGWSGPIQLSPSTASLAKGVSISLHVNHAKPAVSYYSGTPNEDLMYVIALDADGTVWSTPQAIAGPDAVGVDCHLINVGSSPAISYFNDTTNHLEFAICVNAFNQPPTASVTVEHGSLKVGEPFVFDATGSVDTDGEVVMYEWDFGDDGEFELNTGAEGHAEYIYTEPGQYTPHVRITDNSGATAVAFTEVAVLENALPHAHLTVNPDGGNPPLAVDFDASGSYDEDGEIVTFEWDWNGDGEFDASTDNVPYWSWVYETPGQFEPAVKVTDNNGGFSTYAVPLGVNTPPVAVASANPSTGAAPLGVTFNGSASYDPDGSIVAYEWDIHDDGTYEKTGSGVPGDWHTDIIWNGATQVRLRVHDDGGMTGSAVTTVNVSGGWHMQTLDSGGQVGSSNSLAIINGNPAVSYYDFTNHSIKFVRASDADGYSWPAAVTATPISMGSGRICWGTSLALINGSVPGVVFSATCDAFDWQKCYVSAINGNGTAWGALQEVLGGTGSSPSLIIVASNPTFASVSSDLYFSRATNAVGSAWASQKTLAADSGPSGCSMIVVMGQPAIAYTHRPTPGGPEQLCYIRSTDDTGDNWGSPVVVQSELFGLEDVSMTIINGRPAVAYTIATELGGGWNIWYKRAGDQYGNVWPAGHKVITEDGRLGVSLAEVNARPAIALRSCSEFELLYVRANDINGSLDWPNPTLLDNSDNNTGTGLNPTTCLISIGGKPAISYCHSEDGDLKFAVWE